MKSLRFILLVLFFSIPSLLLAQTDKEKAKEKVREAIKLMDGGKVDESFPLLEEAIKLDPENITYPYEVAYAHTLKKDYKKSIEILERLKSHKDATDIFYQLLGNCYDYDKQEEKAFAAYQEGIKRFPKSGKLYLEQGNIYLFKEDYNKAIGFYEKGIEVDPGFSSNYYWASRIYCNSTDEVWGLIYGEIFMNLERNSRRTSEISKLLFDTYKQGITFTEKGLSISFSSNNISVDVSTLGDNKSLKLPFGMIVYEKHMSLAAIGETEIDLESLNRIRQKFLEMYFNSGDDKKFPNALFNYQRDIKNAGHIEAYNYWLVSKGDQDGFEKWYKGNKELFEAFVKWFLENGLQLDEKNRFHRNQY